MRAVRVGACCLALCGCAGWCRADGRPNFVVVVVDDLPDEMCNFLGGDPARNLTPNIDRLAAEGLVLPRMHSPSPICTPSRFAILTGRYPSRSVSEGFRREAERYGQSVVRFDTLIGPTDDTLPRRLQQAGYETAAFGKNHVVEAGSYHRLPYDAEIDTAATQLALAGNAGILREAFHSIGFDVAVEPAALDGTSLVPAIEGRAEEVHDSLYFELGFTRAVQRDGLKYLAVRYPPEARGMPADERARVLEANNAWLTMRGRPVFTADPAAPFSHLSLIPGGNDAERVSMNGHPAYAAPDQLYDLRTDPDEQHNRFDDPAYATHRAELRRLLDASVSVLSDRFGEFGTPNFEP